MTVQQGQLVKRHCAAGNTMVTYGLLGALIVLVGVMGLLTTGSRMNEFLSGASGWLLQLNGTLSPYAVETAGP